MGDASVNPFFPLALNPAALNSRLMVPCYLSMVANGEMLLLHHLKMAPSKLLHLSHQCVHHPFLHYESMGLQLTKVAYWGRRGQSTGVALGRSHMGCPAGARETYSLWTISTREYSAQTLSDHLTVHLAR